MGKIKHDKYYTPSRIARSVIDIAVRTIGKENITEFIEPSAGNGVFLNHLPDTAVAYDIEPEDDRIIKQDYLELELDYKAGRVVIGNPPFGNRNNLARKFCNKSFEIAEYVAFIMPISQLNNTQSIYKYDLIYSESLGDVYFVDRTIHVCFNIYKRPIDDNFNKKINYKKVCSKKIEIKEVRRIKGRNKNSDVDVGDFEYDIGICAWGANIGGICEPKEYAKSFFIKIKDKNNYDKILELIKSADWSKLYPMTTTPNLLQWHVYKYISDNINGKENNGY